MTTISRFTKGQSTLIAKALYDYCLSSGDPADFRMAINICSKIGEVQVADILDEKLNIFSALKATNFADISKREIGPFRVKGKVPCSTKSST